MTQEYNIRVGPGDEYRLALSSNPTTGYSWKILEQTDNIQLVGEDFVLPRRVAPGTGGTQVFIFYFAPNFKHGYVELANIRSWETSTPIHPHKYNFYT